MTDISLKEYFERRIAEIERRLELQFTLNDRAIHKAEETMNARLNSMNEFRDALRDQSNRMATRVELERVEQDLNEVRRGKANLDGRLAVIAAAAGALSAGIIGLVTRFPR